MNKKQALKALKKQGIKLKFVTPMTFKWDHIDIAKRMYRMEEYIVPTKEQYNKIINIVGEDGLYAIMEEYIEHYELRLWSGFGNSSNSWYLYFSSGYSGQAYWNSSTKAHGFSVAFWKLPKNF